MSAIRETLDRIERWCGAASRPREKALEQLLLIDLFQDCLRYSDQSAVSQTPVDKGRSGVADIALRVGKRNRARWVIVEIKRPGVEIADKALQQAGRYVAKNKARRAIITNGKDWVFISIKPKPGALYQFFYSVLLRLSLDRGRLVQRRYLERALSRCFPRNIHNFFSMLEQLNDLEPQKIQTVLRDQVPTKWIEALSGTIRETSGYRVRKRDSAVVEVPLRRNQIALFLNSTVESYRLKQFSLKK